MNTWEIDRAANAAARQGHQTLVRATRLLVAFRDLIDANSDGWAYWKPGGRAAARLIALIKRPAAEVTEAALYKAAMPIRSLCTRHKWPFPQAALDGTSTHYERMEDWIADHSASSGRQQISHPDHPVEQWQRAVATLETREGYFTWLLERAMAADDPAAQQTT